MILRMGKAFFLIGFTLLVAYSPRAQADPPSAGCQVHQQISPHLAAACRKNAETLKKKKAEYEELLKKKTAAMQKSASAFAAGDQTTESAIENAKRMFSSLAAEQEAVIREVEKKRKEVESVQRNFGENIGKMAKVKSGLMGEIKNKTQFIATEKKKLLELQMSRDPYVASQISEKQNRISAAETQLTELNRKRGNIDSAVSADRSSGAQARELGQKFKVSAAELKESAAKLKNQHARLSGISLESASKNLVEENKLRDEVAVEKTKLAEIAETKSSKNFDSEGKAVPLKETGSQKGVRAALEEAKGKPAPNTTEAALVNEGKQMAAEGRVGKYFHETPGNLAEAEQLHAQQSLGTAKAAVAANEKALADIGGEKGLAERLKKSSEVYGGLERDIEGMPASDAEGLKMAKGQWAAQYQKDCQNKAVCNTLNSYGIKPELTTQVGCVGSGICGTEKKVWDENSGLNDIALPTGEQVVKTEGISTELRVAASKENFQADASSRLADMNADTMRSAEEVKRNADLAAKSRMEASSYSSKYESAQCQYNPSSPLCMGILSEQIHFKDTTARAEGQTIRWDPVSAGQVSAMASDPSISEKIAKNVEKAASLESAQASNEMALGFTPVAGSVYGISNANENLTMANAAAVRTGGTSEIATENLLTAKAELSSAKNMAVADVALSATGAGGLVKGGAKAGLKSEVKAAMKADSLPVIPKVNKVDSRSLASASRVKDDFVPAARVAANQNDTASAVKAAANEEVRLNAYRAQAGQAAELKSAKINDTAEKLRLTRQTEATQAKTELKAAANENVRLNAYKADSNRAAASKAAERNEMSENLRINRQLEAEQTAAKASADRALQSEANALKRQTDSTQARSTALANAREEVRLGAFRNQSDQAAQVKAAERNATSESLRLARQMKSDEVAAAKANADRASQVEANALQRQKDATVDRFQTQLNDNVPLSYPKAPPEFKAASAVTGGKPQVTTIYPDTVPEMLTKEKIAHTKVSDSRALVTPGPQTKLNRTAARGESRYGVKTYVDEAVDEEGVAAWATNKEMAFSRNSVKNEVDVGPVAVHEGVHTKNTASQLKKVDEGRSGFDANNIVIGSRNRPTGIEYYDQVSMDEVIAYRGTYDQYRFDAHAARKAGDSKMAVSADMGSESAAYYYGQKLRASTAYLRSADNSLEQMMPAKLVSRQQTIATKELPMGAPKRAASVNSVTVKEISDSSGRSVTLVKTKYEDSREFTSLMMDVRGNNGRVVPMSVPVPNKMMTLPEKVVIADAKGYVGQAAKKMDTYEVLYQKSAAKKAEAYRVWANKPKIPEADAKPGVIGGSSTPRILTSSRASRSNAKRLDDLGIERAADNGRSPAAKFDDPSMIGKSADGPNTSFTPLALEEAADRRIDWVIKQHSEFTAITEADNGKFIKLATKAAVGKAKEYFLVIENAVLKRLNDDVVKDKDLVTALDNLHKEILLQEIKKDPILSKAVVASYNDYKSIGFALKRNDPHIRRLLDEKIAKVNEGFNDFLTKVERAKGWKEKSMGLANDMRTWHHSGIGSTFQEAGLAARSSRELALASGQAKLVNFTDEAAHYITSTDRMAGRADIVSERFKNSGLLESTPHGSALSEDAIEIIRKAKPAGKAEKDLDEAVRAAVKKRYGQEISLEDASQLRAQLKDIDSVNPSLLIEKRVEINMGLHDEGLVSFDFKGQNSRNLYQTQLAILKTKGKDIKTRLEAIAEGDRIATEKLDDMKARVEKSVASLGEKYIGKDVTAVVQKSGDDGVFHPLKQLSRAQKNKLAKALNENGVGESVRVTYLPKKYRNSKTEIAAVDRNRLVVEAEKIEKDLFTEHLVGELPDDIFKGLQVKVDLMPAEKGRSAVGISFAHASGKAIPAKAEEIARQVLKDKYDIAYVDRSNAAGKVPTVRASAPRASKNSYAPAVLSGLVDSREVYAATRAVEEKLADLGVAVSKSDIEPMLSTVERYKLFGGNVRVTSMRYSDGISRNYYGEVFKVEALPRANPKSTAFSPALTHPEMESYLEKMRKSGYELVVDSYQGQIGMPGAFVPSRKIISITPDSDWSTFIHEFQHLEFHENILKLKNFEAIKEWRLAGKKNLVTELPRGYVDQIGAEKLKKMQALFDRGVTTETAVDESLAVGAQLAAMGWKQYIPQGHGQKAYRYMLKHQISGLEALGDGMTAQQRRLVKANKVKHFVSEKVVDRSPAYTTWAGGIGGGGYLAYELYSHLVNDDTAEVFYDQMGNIFIREKDGSYRYVRLRKN